jgi:hypothetical protein
MAAVASMFFLVADATQLFITGYVFAIIGIAILCFGSLYLLELKKAYPWFAAFPLHIWRYLITEVAFSAVFIVCESWFNWSVPIRWFVLIHIVFLALTAVLLISLNAGKDIIEQREAEVREKVINLKSLVADLEAVAERLPSLKSEIKRAADAIRYSDPMSNPALTSFENAIKDSVALIQQAIGKGDEQNVTILCNTLHRQIKDRNSQVKLMK